MVAKSSIGPPGWKAFITAASNSCSVAEREARAQPVISQVQAVLDENSTKSVGSQTLSTALAVGTLNTAIAGLHPEDPHSYWQLLAVNDVVVGSDRRLALALVEHDFLNSLLRLHQKVGNMSHRLSQAVVLVFCSVTLRAEGAAGSMETIAARTELGDLLVSHLTYLAVTPHALLSPAGLGTAQRCLQTCWELTRAPTPNCKKFRDMLQQVHMAGRALQIAATAVGGGDSDGAAAGAATIAGVAAMDGGQGSADAGRGAPAAAAQPAAVGGSSSKDGAAAASEDRLSLAAQACSFAANLAGLGTRGIALTAAGLAPQREWLLKPETLASLRPPLEGLARGLEGLRRRIEAQGPGGDAGGQEEAPAAGSGEEEADLHPGRISPKRLLGHVEGAVRNLLMLLGLPTIVMGTGEDDVVESCGFVIRHSFGLFTEGYVDVMRALREAVSDPPGTGGFSAPYQGDYGPFFRAFAGHVETMATALGVQLEDWGVRFTGEQAARDLPVMEVGGGVDARIAQAWLKGQIQDIINWGHAMMMIVRMADQAKMPAVPPQQQQPGQQPGQQALQKPGPPRPFATGEAAAPAGGAAAADRCASCNATQQASGPPLLWCSRCRGARYCSRACQVGHWPQHKGPCQAVAAAAAPAAPAAAAAVGPVGEAAAATEAPTSSAATPAAPAAEAASGDGECAGAWAGAVDAGSAAAAPEVAVGGVAEAADAAAEGAGKEGSAQGDAAKQDP